MTSAETTPSPHDTTGAYELPPDGGPAPAGAAGPTAAEDAPVLLPVDPPESRDHLADSDGSVYQDDVLPGEDRPVDEDTFVPERDHLGSDHLDSDHVDSDRADALPDVEPAPDPVPAGSPSGQPDWLDLQSKFVDDPAAAVRDAADVVERALADLRGQIDQGDTEQLRTAFRRYRDLYSNLT